MDGSSLAERHCAFIHSPFAVDALVVSVVALLVRCERSAMAPVSMRLDARVESRAFERQVAGVNPPLASIADEVAD